MVTQGSVTHMVHDPPDDGPIKVAAYRLDLARRAAGWSRRELAHRTGVSPGHMSRILRNKSGVSGDVMDGILRAFGNRLTFGELRATQQGPPDESDGPC